MITKITLVSSSEGTLPLAWAFEYCHSDAKGQTKFGSMTADEANRLAIRAEAGAIYEMCRAIQHTPPVEYTWLLGRVFKRATLSDAAPDHITDVP